MASALAGVRVLDASGGIAGPCAAHLLALAGADVIKLEPPAGEWGRVIGRKVGGIGMPFLTFNRGKRSLALDLKDDAGRALARRVADTCDVVIENFRAGVMDRLGLGHAALAADRPALIYCSITGFGARGPHASRPALDTVIQAQSGWLDLLRDAGGEPVLMGYVPVDVLTGVYASNALFAALLARFRFGVGARIEMSLLEAAAAFLAPKLAEQAMAGPAEQSAVSVPTGIFPTAKGGLALAIKDDRDFARLAGALGRPDWIGDARFVTRAARARNRDACEAEVAAALDERNAAEWDARLAGAGVVAASVQTIGEFVADPQVAALKLLRWEDQPMAGRAARITVPGLEPAEAPRPAPAIGAEGREILTEVGVSPQEIADALGRGIMVMEEVA